MENIIGYPQKDRDEIVDAIYGPNGLTEKVDSDTFNCRLNTEKDNRVGEKKFSHYFNNKLIPLLKEHVIDPVKRQNFGYMDKQQL